jgi:hypothetical protein
MGSDPKISVVNRHGQS